jgi:glycosyltransferase involved in cell wall biosynthesis
MYKFFVLLYGSLEYDGRVKRMLEVIASLGEHSLLDLAPCKVNDAAPNRFRISFSPQRGQAWRHLYFWCKSILLAIKIKPKVIIGEDYFTAFPAWLASIFCGAIFIYDAHELIIPEVSGDVTFRESFWYRLEKLVINKADLIIAANADRAKLMQEHYKLARIPSVMRNIPPNPERSNKPSELLRKFPALVQKEKDEKWMLYQGVITKSRGIDRFIEVLRCLPSNYKMIIAGDGPFKDKLLELASDLAKGGRIIFLGRIENHLLYEITVLADVGIVTYPNTGLNNIYCAPNKLFEYAQAYLPIIATSQPPLRDPIRTYSIGEIIEESASSKEIASVVVRVANNKDSFRPSLQRFLSDNTLQLEVERIQKDIRAILSED